MSRRRPPRGGLRAYGYRQCPVCRSWDTTRHAEGFRVWFTCNKCGAVFS